MLNMKILYVGNSITKHSPAPAIGWNGDWGMAAGSENSDYVHVLNSMIEKAGKTADAMVRNAADFERDPAGFDLNVLSDLRRFNADIIIMRIIENTPDDKLADFRKAYPALIKYLDPDGGAKIFCTGSFWKRGAADELIREAADCSGCVYVPLDSLHDVKYQAAGLFSHNGVAAHPSDAGMKAIAQLLYAAISKEGLLSNAAVYPVPDGEPVSPYYSVTVDGVPAGCYTCRVSAMPFNRVWPGKQRPIEQSEEAAFVYFDMTSPAEVAVTASCDFSEVSIRPLSKKIEYSVEGRTVKFTVKIPGQYSFELDGRHHNLHIFANPADDYKRDENTIYFGAGVHNAGAVELRSGQTLFVDAGAVVHAAVRCEDCENVSIIGHGIIDYSGFERHDPLEWERDGLINIVRCRNVHIDGVILRDSSWWTITAFNCRNLWYNNVKAVGMWRYNTDGFDFVNSQNVRVSNCFLRSFDDVIVLKGLRIPGYGYERMNVQNYLIENCVIWCDWGGGLEIGAETVADEYSNIIYRNCDIIRNDSGAMRIQSGDRAVIHNVLYENINVEYSKYNRATILQGSDEAEYKPEDVPSLPPVINGWMYNGVWSKDMIYGNIYDITYRNISVTADEGIGQPCISFAGKSESNKFDMITVENFTFNGKNVKPDVRTNEFVGQVTVK